MYELLHGDKVVYKAKTEAQCWAEKERIAQPILLGQPILFWTVREVKDKK